MRQAKASRCSTKSPASEELIAAIRAAAAGQSYLQARVAALRAQALRSLAPRLNGRQGEILKLLAEGLSNKEIGARLGKTERTAKFHFNARATAWDSFEDQVHVAELMSVKAP